MTITKYDAISHMTVLTVLVFGPESVSYERSRRDTAAKMQHFSARVFFVKIPQRQPSEIHAILRFFRILFLKNVLAQNVRARAWARAQPHGPSPMGPGPY